MFRYMGLPGCVESNGRDRQDVGYMYRETIAAHLNANIWFPDMRLNSGRKLDNNRFLRLDNCVIVSLYPVLRHGDCDWFLVQREG